MDISGLSISMAQANVTSDFGIAMLDKSLDTLEDTGNGFIKMMEQSVAPNLGANIDVSL